MSEDNELKFYEVGEVVADSGFRRRYVDDVETTPVYVGDGDMFGEADHLGLRAIVWEGDLYARLFGSWVIMAGHDISPRVTVHGWGE